MRFGRALQVITVLVLSLATSLSAWGIGGAASAAAAPACSALSGTNGVKWALTKCTDVAHTGGKGTAVSSFGAGGTGTTKVTWNKTGTTTISFTYMFTSPNVCPSPQVEIKETGKVVGGTGAALNSIKKGQKTAVTLCQGPKSVSLLKGTTFVV